MRMRKTAKAGIHPMLEVRSSAARSRRIFPLDGRCARDNHEGFGVRNRRRRRRASRTEGAGRRVAFSKLSLPRNKAQESGQARSRRSVSSRGANRCRPCARREAAMTHQCNGKGCGAIIPVRWGDFCSCCFYEGMNPQEFRAWLEAHAELALAGFGLQICRSNA